MAETPQEERLPEMSSESTAVARRGHRQGSLYQIKPGQPGAGSWRCEVKTPDGKKRTYTNPSKDLVEAKLLEFQNAIVKHEPLPPGRTRRVGEYALEWSANRKDVVSPGAWKGDDSNVRNHIVKSLGTRFLAELTPADMGPFYRECAGRGLSHTSVSYVRGTLRLILAQAMVDGLVTRNVAADVKLGKRPRNQVKFKANPFTNEEARQFLDRVKGTDAEALYVTTIGLGLRREEVCGLRWVDVNFRTRQVTLTGVAQRIEGEGVVWVPKGKTDDSLVTLDVPDFVLDVLVAHHDRHQWLEPRPEYVFPGLSDSRRPYDPDKATKDFPKWLDAHGLRRIRFHDLRHSAGSMYLALGVPLWEVSKILRHSSIKMTNDVYGHMFPQTSRKNADLMSDWMAGKVAIGGES